MAPEKPPGRPKPVYGRTLAGKILWLPKKEEISPALDTDLAPGVYNHPVLILSHEPREDGTVRALTMTSVNGRNITEDMTFHWKLREKYLPVAPTPPHADSDLQLHLAGDSPSSKACRPAYVMIRQGPYTLHFDALRAHQGNSLSSKSFGIVVTEMGYTEEKDYLREQRDIERKEEKVKRKAFWDQREAERQQKTEEKRITRGPDQVPQKTVAKSPKVSEKKALAGERKAAWEQRQVVKKEKAEERGVRKAQKRAIYYKAMAEVDAKWETGFCWLMAGIFVATLCLEALLWYGFWLVFGFW